jgi:undecaprenyl-diphosphatase
MRALDGGSTSPTWRERVSQLDRTWIVWVARWRRRPITRFMRLMSRIGNPESVAIIAIFAAALGLTMLAIAIGVSAIAGGTAAQIVKRLFGRQRPNARIEGFVSIAGNPDKFSFPSGHSATAFSVAAALFDHPTGAGGFAFPSAILIAVSRVYLGAHYPLDVAAGAVLGTVIGSAVRAIMF